MACEALEPRWLLAGVGLVESGAPDEPAALVSPLIAEPVAQPFVVTSASSEEAGPLAGSANPGGFSPAQMRHAYGFDQIYFEGGTITGDGTGQTIAIVNAYHTPSAASDLAAFSTYFGLPSVASFVQVNQTGGTSYPATDGGWALETALDVQWAHAFAPAANILLVEANSAGFSDLMVAVDYARSQPGVSVVSLSWGTAGEFATETNYDFHFTTPSGHAGVTFFAAAGNSGGPGGYPAYSPNVVAVGGTTLALNGANNISSESAWSGSGGGISQYEAQSSWQSGVVTQTTTRRAMPDVAFDANPSTGVSVYDTFNNSVSTPWSKVAGTSFATPSWGALVAIANQGRALAGLAALNVQSLMTMLYAMPSVNFRDITTGASGGSTPQSAGPGYDLVTGRGSPKAQFVAASLVGLSSQTSAAADVTLAPGSDSGISNSDGITNRDNGSSTASLQFTVAGTIAGATVTIASDGTPIGSAIASGSTTVVVTDGATTLADGVHSITARQTAPGQATSAASPALAITVDTTAPISSIAAVSPDPRSTPVDQMTINFNEPVMGLGLDGLELLRDSLGNQLTAAQAIDTPNGIAWTLHNLTGITVPAGFYELFLTPSLSGATDAAGNAPTGAYANFTVAPSTVAGRLLFYNQSSFDGNNAAISAADDSAIATDKAAYLPGAMATAGNVSSYWRGINGVMVDVANPGGTLTADDFTFRVGRDNSPEAWTAAPAPLAVSVRAGAGTNGSDRVEIIWADRAIADTWLQVIVEGNDAAGGFNANTGLAASDVFFFGNRIGDTLNDGAATVFVTNAADEVATRTQVGPGATITNVYDFDRNGAVSAADQIISRGNIGYLTKINISSPPAAPAAAPAAAVEPAPLGPPATIGAATPSAARPRELDFGMAFALIAEQARRQLLTNAAWGDWLGQLDEPLVDLIGRQHFARRR